MGVAEGVEDCGNELEGEIEKGNVERKEGVLVGVEGKSVEGKGNGGVSVGIVGGGGVSVGVKGSAEKPEIDMAEKSRRV